MHIIRIKILLHAADIQMFPFVLRAPATQQIKKKLDGRVFFLHLYVVNGTKVVGWRMLNVWMFHVNVGLQIKARKTYFGERDSCSLRGMKNEYLRWGRNAKYPGHVH